MTDTKNFVAALETGGFIMCEDKRTVEELHEQISRLERELEIAKLEKQVRELWANIERARAYPPRNPPWYHPCETGSTTTWTLRCNTE